MDGPCTFTGLHRVNPFTGSPVRDNAEASPDGTATWSAEYAMSTGTHASVWVRASLSDGPALQQYFSQHREAHCGGIIIRAPCPPGVHVTVHVPPPPIGTVLPNEF